ncbi:MAG TPA: DUF4381 family protein [Verrucomicrobiae bacterium]|nr:DUF4381 family protein [Verrucomicrobiae bacterium]
MIRWLWSRAIEGSVFFLTRQVAAAAGGEGLTLSPPHPEIPATFLEQYWLWVISGSLALAIIVSAFGLVLWLTLRSRGAGIPSPDEIARKELQRIHQEAATSANLSAISRVLRAYLVARFQLPAEEFTTRELSDALLRKQSVGPQLATRLNSFFKRCDELKFAPSTQPPATAAEEALALVNDCERRRAELLQASLKAPPIHS